MPKALSKMNIYKPLEVQTFREFKKVSGGPVWTSRDFEMRSGTGPPDTTTK